MYIGVVFFPGDTAGDIDTRLSVLFLSNGTAHFEKHKESLEY
jgi:hypothetical protein